MYILLTIYWCILASRPQQRGYEVPKNIWKEKCDWWMFFRSKLLCFLTFSCWQHEFEFPLYWNYIISTSACIVVDRSFVHRPTECHAYFIFCYFLFHRLDSAQCATQCQQHTRNLCSAPKIFPLPRISSFKCRTELFWKIRYSNVEHAFEMTFRLNLVWWHLSKWKTAWACEQVTMHVRMFDDSKDISPFWKARPSSAHSLVRAANGIE